MNLSPVSILQKFRKDEIVTSIFDDPIDKLALHNNRKKNVIIRDVVKILKEKHSDVDELKLFVYLRYYLNSSEKKSWNVFEIKNGKRFNHASDLTSDKIKNSMEKYFSKYNCVVKTYCEKRGYCFCVTVFFVDSKLTPTLFVVHMKLSLVFYTRILQKYQLLIPKVLRKTFRGESVELFSVFQETVLNIQKLQTKPNKLQTSNEKPPKLKDSLENAVSDERNEVVTNIQNKQCANNNQHNFVHKNKINEGVQTVPQEVEKEKKSKFHCVPNEDVPFKTSEKNQGVSNSSILSDNHNILNKKVNLASSDLSFPKEDKPEKRIDNKHFVQDDEVLQSSVNFVSQSKNCPSLKVFVKKLCQTDLINRKNGETLENEEKNWIENAVVDDFKENKESHILHQVPLNKNSKCLENIKRSNFSHHKDLHSNLISVNKCKSTCLGVEDDKISKNLKHCHNSSKLEGNLLHANDKNNCASLANDFQKHSVLVENVKKNKNDRQKRKQSQEPEQILKDQLNYSQAKENHNLSCVSNSQNNAIKNDFQKHSVTVENVKKNKNDRQKGKQSQEPEQILKDRLNYSQANENHDFSCISDSQNNAISHETSQRIVLDVENDAAFIKKQLLYLKKCKSNKENICSSQESLQSSVASESKKYSKALVNSSQKLSNGDCSSSAKTVSIESPNKTIPYKKLRKSTYPEDQLKIQNNKNIAVINQQICLKKNKPTEELKKLLDSSNKNDMLEGKNLCSFDLAKKRKLSPVFENKLPKDGTLSKHDTISVSQEKPQKCHQLLEKQRNAENHLKIKETNLQMIPSTSKYIEPILKPEEIIHLEDNFMISKSSDLDDLPSTLIIDSSKLNKNNFPSLSGKILKQNDINTKFSVAPVKNVSSNAKTLGDTFIIKPITKSLVQNFAVNPEQTFIPKKIDVEKSSGTSQTTYKRKYALENTGTLGYHVHDRTINVSQKTGKPICPHRLLSKENLYEESGRTVKRGSTCNCSAKRSKNGLALNRASGKNNEADLSVEHPTKGTTNLNQTYILNSEKDENVIKNYPVCCLSQESQKNLNEKALSAKLTLLNRTFTVHNPVLNKSNNISKDNSVVNQTKRKESSKLPIASSGDKTRFSKDKVNLGEISNTSRIQKRPLLDSLFDSVETGYQTFPSASTDSALPEKKVLCNSQDSIEKKQSKADEETLKSPSKPIKQVIFKVCPAEPSPENISFGVIFEGDDIQKGIEKLHSLGIFTGPIPNFLKKIPNTNKPIILITH